MIGELITWKKIFLLRGQLLALNRQDHFFLTASWTWLLSFLLVAEGRIWRGAMFTNGKGEGGFCTSFYQDEPGLCCLELRLMFDYLFGFLFLFLLFIHQKKNHTHINLFLQVILLPLNYSLSLHHLLCLPTQL